MKNVSILLLLLIASGCNAKKEEAINVTSIIVEKVEIPKLDLVEANRLAQLPLHCLDEEYPNKLSQTLGGSEDLLPPKILHPAFYGCFDWHSAVHGYWSLVRLLKQFPELENSEAIKVKLLEKMSKDNILKEVEYFYGKHNKSYERTYGWAWLLKLAEELNTWDDPTGKELEKNLLPLTNLIVEKYIDFLPKLNYPMRVGTHTNTAFGLSFAYDFARTTNNELLVAMIVQRAKDFYLTDSGCPITWEPSGSDFLSPCLEEAALMKRVFSAKEFKNWMTDFFPQLKDKNFSMKVGKVSDREDGHLVHLDGVNFSRAWSMYKIAEGLAEYDHLKNLANLHINHSLPSIVDGNYEGTHWLGSFAIYALNAMDDD